MLRVLALAAIWSATTTVAVAAQRAAEVLPQSTTAYLATDNLPQLRAAWQQTQFDQLLRDEEMQPFVAELTDYLNHGLPGKLPPLGVSWTDLANLANGEVCLAQVALPSPGEVVSPLTDEPVEKPAAKQPLPSAFALLVKTDDKQAKQIDALLAALDAAYTAQGATKHSSNVGETTIVSYQWGNNNPPRTRCYFHTDGWLCVTSDLALANDVALRIARPRNDSLAALSAFGYVTRTKPADANMPGHVRWFIEPFDLQRQAQDDADQDNAQPDGEETLQLEDEGLDVIQGIGGVMAFDHQSYDLLRRTAVYAPGPLTKVAQVLTFDLEKQLARVPAWVPADTRQYTSVRWRLPAALRGYGALFDAMYGAEGDFEFVLEDWQIDEPGSPQVDVRKDLLANLEPPLLILRLGDANPNEAGNETLAAMRTTNPKVVAEAVRKMFEGDQQIVKCMINNHTVWFYDPQKAAAAAGNNQPAFGPDLTGYAFVVANNFLYVATDIGPIEKILQQKPGTSKLADDGTYQQAVKSLERLGARETFAHQFLGPGEGFRSAYEQLRKPNADEATWVGGWMAGMISGLAPDVDYTKLPPFKVVKRHLASSSAQGTRSDSGWQRVGLTPKKE